MLSAPVVTSDPAPVPAAADLQLIWSRGAADVSLIISGSSTRADGKPGYSSLYCSFPTESGTGTIAKGLLQRLLPDTQLTLATAHYKSIQAGDYAVALGVVTSVQNATRDHFVQLQVKQ